MCSSLDSRNSVAEATIFSVLEIIQRSSSLRYGAISSRVCASGS